MIVHTPAIVLRFDPVTNTSRRVVWFTRDAGRVTTLIKGSQRPKSWFLGQYDLFYTCDLVFYLRGRRSLQIARECAPLHARPAFRDRWRAAAAASYACDLVMQSTPVEQPQPAVFHLLERFLSLAAETEGVENLLYWFELNLLFECGLQPRLDRCPACGRSLTELKEARFSIDLGGLVCGQCEGGGRETFHISMDSVNILRAWQRSKRASAAVATRCSDRQIMEIRKVLDLFLRYHLEHQPASRILALSILDVGNKRE